MAKSKGRQQVTYSKYLNDFKIVPIKQVYTKKYIAWSSIEKTHYVLESVNTLKPKVIFYRLRSDMHRLPHIPIRNLYLDNTIQVFYDCSSEQGYELPYHEDICSTLRQIIKKDVPFSIDGEIYLYHSYMILGFMRESYLAYQLSENENFINSTIAKFKRQKQSFKLEYKKYKKLHLKHKQDKEKNKEQTDYFMTAFIYRTLCYRSKYLKYFLACFSMIGLSNIPILETLNDYEREKIQEVLTMFMSGRVTKHDCADSLSVVLYYYLLYKMRFRKNDALIYTRYLVYSVYGYVNSYTGSELLRNVHIKEVIDSHIVFNCSVKTKMTSESQKNYLENISINALEESGIDSHRFATEQIRPILENPLKLYIQFSPMELLEEY